MSTVQRLGLGLFYAAMPVLGAAYAVFEHQQANNWLAYFINFINEAMPSCLMLILVFVVYGLFRKAASVLKQLNGVSLAAHATLHVDYGKASRTKAV